MKLLRLLPLFASAAIAAACTHDLDASLRPDASDPNDPYAISIDEALDNLQSVLAAIDDGGTRAASCRRIREVRTFRNPQPQDGTRSENATPRNLIHVVNYEDNGGFAVLSADKRLPSDVLAVTESGNINMVVLDSICTARTKFPIIDRKDSLPYDPNLPDPIYDGFVDLVINPDLHLNDNPPSQYYYSDYPMYDYGPWTDLIRVIPLIHSKWNQSEPFNYFAVKSGRGPSAGCGPVALAQFLAYCKLQRNVSLPLINNKTMNWQAINNTFTGEPAISKYGSSINVTYSDWIAVADLIYQCGELLDVTYRSDGTGCNDSDISNVFNNLNFITDFGRVDFSPEVAYLMIVTRQLPVIMGEDKHNQHNKGHYWVLDGWLKESRNIKELYQGKVTNRSQTRDLVHCNWGWGGEGDGYFYPGHFRTSDREGYEEKYLDSDSLFPEDRFYASNPKLFTYQLR